MSAGKVMLGTDGNPLLSADGKIVLADDLYPMVPTQQSDIYYRESSREDNVCSATEVWSVDWSTPWEGFGSASYRMSDTWTITSQSVLQTKFAGNSIDWARVKKLTQSIYIFAYNYGETVWYGRLTASKNNDVIPVGYTIRDTWDTKFTYVSDGVPASTIFQGWVTVEWEINGVEPDSVECAVMLDDTTCSSSFFAGRIDSSVFGAGPIRVVYNLAA
jgi:hypothetical protein